MPPKHRFDRKTSDEPLAKLRSWDDNGKVTGTRYEWDGQGPIVKFDAPNQSLAARWGSRWVDRWRFKWAAKVVVRPDQPKGPGA